MSSDQIDKFRLRLIPELAFFDSATAADESWKNAKSVRPLWVFFVLLLAVAAAFTSVMFVVKQLFQAPVWTHAVLMGFGSTAVSTLTSSYLGYYYWREPMRRVVRENLQAAGIPVCLTCGYDLRGQEAARCPECGEHFDEKLLRARTAHLEPAQRED